MIALGAPSWVPLLFPDGEPLVYASSLAGKRYATQWTSYMGPVDGGLHEIEFLLELDPTAVGHGGALLKQRSNLICDGSLGPVRYSSQAGATRWVIHFESSDVRIELPDGSWQTVARSGAQFIVDGNLPGQKALLHGELSHRKLLDRETSVRVFLPGQLVTVPYQAIRAPDLTAESGDWYRSSHHEEFLLDARGMMLEGRMPTKGILTWLERHGPPLPTWRDEVSLAPDSLHYEPPENARFRLDDVTVPGPVTPIGATLSIPEGPGPFPAVLFLSGSGTHDRHGITREIDIGTHEIMDHLAEQGFVGLRFDTRGAGTTRLGADALDRGIDSDIADARACLDFLRTRPEVTGRPLFLLGHSQGGTGALALAGETGTSLRGVILMATMGRGLDEVIADQLVVQGKVVGLTDEQISHQIEQIREAARLVMSDLPWEAEKIPDHVLAMFRSRTWFKQFLSYRTWELITRIRCPVLVCQGRKDFQVSAERDAERLVEAARRAGIDCTYGLFSDLDHLFKPTKGASNMAQYFDRTRHVGPEFLACLVSWLRDHSS